MNPRASVIRPRPAAVLRSVQKDEQYSSWFRTETNLVLQKMLGPRTWIQWKQQIELLSDAIYYTATTLNGVQTLGEEYVRIVQIEGNQLKAPTFRRRFVMVLLETSGPLILEFLFKRANQLLEEMDLPLWPQLLNVPGMREQLVEWLPMMRESLQLVQRAHIVLFYFLGSHYQMSKRLTGISYTAVRTWMIGSGTETTYTILGFVTLSQLLMTILIKYWSAQSKAGKDESGGRVKAIAAQSVPMICTHVGEEAEERNEEEEEELYDPKQKCSLCLDKRKDSTATPCGHMFCWTCIHDWMENKTECPICRAKFDPSRLVYLQN